MHCNLFILWKIKHCKIEFMPTAENVVAAARQQLRWKSNWILRIEYIPYRRVFNDKGSYLCTIKKSSFLGLHWNRTQNYTSFSSKQRSILDTYVGVIREKKSTHSSICIESLEWFRWKILMFDAVECYQMIWC